ncbi:MAG: hypothetical protein AB8G99_10015 [Planctomycetaceae bacterium]
MSDELPILNRSSIPNPCPVAWDDMTGDDKSRHCSQCDKSVYHLSNRTAQEATKLIADHKGDLCVQGIFRVSDGKLITKPTRKQRLGRFIRRMIVATATLPLVALFSGCGE